MTGGGYETVTLFQWKHYLIPGKIKACLALNRTVTVEVSQTGGRRFSKPAF